MKKDEALRKAKLDYIQQNSHLEAHPFYWAGLIPLGDMEPIAFTSNFKKMLLPALLVLGGILLFFFIFKKIRKA